MVRTTAEHEHLTARPNSGMGATCERRVVCARRAPGVGYRIIAPAGVQKVETAIVHTTPDDHLGTAPHGGEGRAWRRCVGGACDRPRIRSRIVATTRVDFTEA